MNCFAVFIIVLVAVIFLVVYLHRDHLVTTFELSHILRIVSFFLIIAPYKYSYLLTYLTN